MFHDADRKQDDQVAKRQLNVNYGALNSDLGAEAQTTSLSNSRLPAFFPESDGRGSGRDVDGTHSQGFPNSFISGVIEGPIPHQGSDRLLPFNSLYDTVPL